MQMRPKRKVIKCERAADGSMLPGETVGAAASAPLVGWSAEGSPRLLPRTSGDKSDLSPLSEEDSHRLTETKKRTRRKEAPDGGWGWVIVLCSLIISLIQDGVSFSFGLIYIELLREFGESKSKTSWVGALFLAIPLLAGPFASALVERYGCRAMTIVGGLLSALGFVLSAVLGRSIETLLLTFGLVSGLGLALGYVTAVVSVAYWFDKRRSLANGLGVCGTGIGTFVFAPLTQLCLDEYGWRGTTMILGGAFLHMCICGAAMREPEWIKKENNNKLNKEDNNYKWTIESNDLIKVDKILLDNNVTPLINNYRAVSLSPAPINPYQLSQHRHSLTYRGALVRLAPPWSSDEDEGRAASCPDLLVAGGPPPAAPPWWRRSTIVSLLATSLDLSLFLEPPFFLLAAGTLLLFTCFIVPYFYLAEHMLRHGYTDTDASFLIAIIGVPNTIAMVALGWAGDKPWLPVAHTYAACLVVCGLSTLAMPLLVGSFAGLAAAAALFGLSFAANFSFTPVLLVQLVAMERFTTAYGLVLLVQGAGNLLGPPLAGWLFDLTGTWDLSFYLAGVFIVIAGVLTLLIPVYHPQPPAPTPAPSTLV